MYFLTDFLYPVVNKKLIHDQTNFKNNTALTYLSKQKEPPFTLPKVKAFKSIVKH